MYSKSLTKQKMPLLEFLFAVCLFALYLLPSVSIGSTTFLMVLLVYCVYMAVANSNMLSLVAVFLLLIAALAMFYSLLTDTSSIAQGVANREYKQFISKFYQYLSLYFPALLFIRISKSATDKQKKILAIIGVALMVYVIITTWIYLLENPDATREWENFAENSEEGVANYYFIYAIPIIISTISILMMRAKLPMRLASVALITAGIVFLVNAQYTLSILIALVGLMIQIFRNIRSNGGKLLFLFLLGLFVVFLPDILAFVIDIIPSRQVTERLSEIRAFLMGSGAGGYNLNGRLTLYGRTVEAFFDSPIWGNRHLDFDGHATFLTVLSDTGLLGAVPFYALLVYTCKNIKKQLPTCRVQFNVIIAMFVMMGLTNPIHASMPLGFATWFLAPLMIQLIFKEKSQNEKSLEN